MRHAWIVCLLAVAACTQPVGAPKAADPKAVAAGPTTGAVGPLDCKADRTLECSAAGCEGVRDDYLKVELRMEPGARTGVLCRADQCEGVTLLAIGSAQDALSGLVIRSGVGAAGESRPASDLALTIAPDQKTFTLMTFSGGRFSGFGGACAPAGAAE